MQNPAESRRARFARLAHECGFELSGVAPALPLDEFSFYRQWVAEGMAGPMGYLADHRGDLRADPRTLLPTAKSVLCVGKLYKTKESSGGAGVSNYAWGSADYHDLLRRNLESLVDRLKAEWGDFDARICVDTAPLLERAYAHAAGLGWIGNNTCLINEPAGSWFFLGEVLVSIELPPDSPPPDRCGTCTRCIDACPTSALIPGPGSPGPDFQLDGRLCISTLTIELRGAVPVELRPGIGEHLFGCDICQDVCPWNRKAPVSLEPAFQPIEPAMGLEEIASMTPEEFRERYRRTPLWRSKHAGILRNAAIAMGNSRDPRYRQALENLAASEDDVVAEHARWALGRLEEASPR